MMSESFILVPLIARLTKLSRIGTRGTTKDSRAYLRCLTLLYLYIISPETTTQGRLSLPFTASPIHANSKFSIGKSEEFSPTRAARYISHFGPLNRRTEISNHSIIFVDAPGLVEEDRQRLQYGYTFKDWAAKPGGAIDFVKKLPPWSVDEKPTVLFSHIPLARPAGTDCGPLREKGSINQGWGFGYQNTLTEEASEFLLGSIRPSIIFRCVRLLKTCYSLLTLITVAMIMIIARPNIHYHPTPPTSPTNTSKQKKYP